MIGSVNSEKGKHQNCLQELRGFNARSARYLRLRALSA